MVAETGICMRIYIRGLHFSSIELRFFGKAKDPCLVTMCCFAFITTNCSFSGIFCRPKDTQTQIQIRYFTKEILCSCCQVFEYMTIITVQRNARTQGKLPGTTQLSFLLASPFSTPSLKPKTANQMNGMILLDAAQSLHLPAAVRLELTEILSSTSLGVRRLSLSIFVPPINRHLSLRICKAEFYKNRCKHDKL